MKEASSSVRNERPFFLVLKYMLGCGNNIYADFLRFRRAFAKGLALNYHSRIE
ncbi:hypothetical protein ALCH109712_14200 [Alkalicoccus chagannorensis]